VETPHKFITAVINLRRVSTNKTIICFIAMQTYKELRNCIVLLKGATQYSPLFREAQVGCG
jgi:hypothetical protein